MKGFPNIFGRRALTLLFVCALAVLVTAFGVAEWAPRQIGNVRAATAFLSAAALVILLLIAWRLVRFRGRLTTLLRRLVSGDYEVGLRAPSRWHDEVSTLEGLLNNLVEQLRTYDALRIRRIRQLRMGFDLVVEHAGEPMMLFDVEKQAVACNPAMLAILTAPKPAAPLDVLQQLEHNTAFLDMLDRAVAREKSEQQGRAAVQFPAQETPRQFYLRIVPLKDKDETVPWVVIFGKLCED